MLKNIVLLWAILMRATYCNAGCYLELPSFVCEEIKWDDFYNEFFSIIPLDDIPNLHSITITNSEVPTIEYFPQLHEYSNITEIAILNSSLEHVNEGAFKAIEHLDTLDLSHNSLKNINFLQSVPTTLKRINLSYNQIVYMDNVFHNLKDLKHLSMSHNNLSIVDLNNTVGIPNLDLSSNNISALIGAAVEYRYCKLDLSYNSLKTFSEEELLITADSLDVSYNKIKQIKAPHTLELSYSGNKGFNFQLGKLERFVLTGTSIPKLKESIMDLKFMQKGVLQLSNCSITKISRNYFHDFNVEHLNLSYNNIKFIEESTFSRCEFTSIDLSYSQLKTAQYAFDNVSSDYIYLNNNNITNAKNIFSSVVLYELHLSHNPIKVLFKSTFAGCLKTEVLNLSNCQIEFIERNSFEGLTDLRQLDLSNNAITILEPGTFQHLPVQELTLGGNRIHTLRNRSFHNMADLRMLNLSDLGVSELESHTFFNLPALETIDLSSNSVNAIPEELFVNCEKLQELFLHGNPITSLAPFSNKLKINLMTLSFANSMLAHRIQNINLKEIKIIDSHMPVLKNGSFKGLYNLYDLNFQNILVDEIESGAFETLYNLKELNCTELFNTTKNIRFGTFKGLRSLEMLALSELSIETLESGAFIGLNSLKELFLDHNNISELNKSSFVGLDSLKNLDLSYNSIGSILKEMFDGIVALKALYLEYNNISSINADSFNELPLLEKLYINGNQLQVLDKDLFAHNSKLAVLYIQENKIKELPVGIFQYLTELEVLNVSSNKLAIISIGTFSNLRSLRILDLSSNDLVTLEHASAFYSAKKLEKLYLDNNHLKLFDFDRLLTNLKSIKYMGISANKWQCNNLSHVIETLSRHGVSYNENIKAPMYDNDNIDGIGCIDICKFVYCSHENIEDTLHYY
ncbi:unnamed protein product [Callosobruchus maculatus]|uniref:LRRCT domain-containing protein n=1 Tax=Callosobruchus maculatus TaxID=64391 RepID=A0A653D045_CALMS|nr:unnamed protein product [Callosobruchus maculatus]